MNWQPHFKLRFSNGIKTFTHNFMKSDVSEKELIEAFNKLKMNFEPNEKLSVSTGY